MLFFNRAHICPQDEKADSVTLGPRGSGEPYVLQKTNLKN